MGAIIIASGPHDIQTASDKINEKLRAVPWESRDSSVGLYTPTVDKFLLEYLDN